MTIDCATKALDMPISGRPRRTPACYGSIGSSAEQSSLALHHNGAGAVLSYMYAYSFYLFFDFAGYSAFAIGVSYVLGVHAPENFRRPFLARNIREFWDRWRACRRSPWKSRPSGSRLPTWISL